jgi:hypothetical protein
MNALIGFTGFVGGHLLHRIKNCEYYNSSNISTIENKMFDTVYCCGLYAEKWKANKNAEEDLKGINLLISYLSKIKCNKFILISTVDVLNCEFEQYEEQMDIIYSKYSTHSYGINRRNFELWCLATFIECYIFRLPALFGRGLKKNPLYDLINNNNVHLLRGHWEFQWYNIEWLYEDIQKHVSKNIKLVNLVTPPIKLSTIQKLFFPSNELSNDKVPSVKYNVRSFYKTYNIEDVLIDMKNFIFKQDATNIICSELAWHVEHNDVMCKFLNLMGIREIEAVPSKNNWNMSLYTSIYSIQSLLYGNSINIFQEKEKFIDIVSNICDMTSGKQPKVFIFGSPKNRAWNGEEYISMFRKIGDIVRKYNIIFCIEHNSQQYTCNWMTTFKDTYELIKEIDHPNIKLNIDTGNLIMEKEELPYLFDTSLVGHVQVSFPFLSNWNSEYEPFIKTEIRKIRKNGYIGKFSLEMKPNNDPPFNDVLSFIELMRQV